MPPFLEELGVPGQIAAVADMDDLAAKITTTWETRDALIAAMQPNVAALARQAKRHIPYILGKLQ